MPRVVPKAAVPVTLAGKIQVITHVQPIDRSLCDHEWQLYDSEGIQSNHLYTQLRMFWYCKHCRTIEITETNT